ncbi:hypothetical protein D6827_03375 [Candidatus Parcubacteria bacterium]|nr:MAG: hypothetical protein D6827_03375 [Candidatus Parcubacteria bacterium]
MQEQEYKPLNEILDVKARFTDNIYGFDWIKLNKTPITSKIKENGEAYDTYIINPDLADNKKFSVINGVLTFKNGKGELYMAPHSDERQKALEDAGYVEGNVPNSIANGSVFIDPRLRHLWREMRAQQHQQILSKMKEEVIRKNNIDVEKEQELLQIKWFDLNGAEMTVASVGGLLNSDNTIKISEHPFPPHERGKFSIVNGVISFIDASGYMHTLPSDYQLESKLKRAGYSEGDVPNYLGNGYRFTDPELQERWNVVKKEIKDRR